MAAQQQQQQHQELITQALAHTLDPNPTTRSQAELTLKQAKTTSDHFGLILIAITQNHTIHTSIRQASALAFKNYVKSSWSQSVSSLLLSSYFQHDHLFA